jgi:putative ABC transport system permease protein
LTGIVLNEEAVRTFGYASAEEAIGQDVIFPGGQNNRREIIGVVKDFNSASAHQKIGPVAMVYNFFAFYAFVRITPAAAPTVIAQMEEIWNVVVPGYVFDLRFLDDRFGVLYSTERVLRKLLLYFAALTIFIACLGLFGLASYAAEKRTKEVGIRKALGATIGGARTC